MMNDSPSLPAAFSIINNYYDLIYQEKDYANETKYVIDILNANSSNVHHLLELGFGTGNYSKYFANAGYIVTGVEKCKSMVALAKAKSIPNFFPVTGDITNFSFKKKFDAAISLFHVISYLTKNKDVLLCFRQVSKHLRKNGLFIFDVWYTAAVYSQQPRNTTKNISTDTYDIKRMAEPIVLYEQNIIQINYQLLIKNKLTQHVEELKEVHCMRHFSTPEIKLMAKLSGFRLVNAEEFLTAKKPGADTWGVCYTLRKND